MESIREAFEEFLRKSQVQEPVPAPATKSLITEADREAILEFVSDLPTTKADHQETTLTQVHPLYVSPERGPLQIVDRPLQIGWRTPRTGVRCHMFTWRENLDRLIHPSILPFVRILRIDAWFPYVFVKVYTTAQFRPFDTIEVVKQTRSCAVQKHWAGIAYNELEQRFWDMFGGLKEEVVVSSLTDYIGK